ncbi:MAG: hypothetical protein KGJ56_08420, partial [Gammaproteobacteria bacterium]|nr:hypothetical protein [Gammaproteobacteria bacterium]
SVQPRENAFFRLIKGGFRALSGLIGHVDHADYAVETPVATIGIRGTGYEVRYCASNCGDSSGGSQQGLYTAVGKGAIALSNDSGETVTRAGQYGYIAGRQMHFRPLARAPRALARMQLPQRYWRRDAAMRQHVNSVRARRWPHYQRTLEQRLGRPPARGLREFMHPHAAGAKAPRPEDRRAQPAAEQRQAFHATAAKIRPPRQPHRKKAAKKPPEQRRRHGGAT